MKKYKIIYKYDNQQQIEFSNKNDALKWLEINQRIGKIGELKGKPIYKIRVVDTIKQREYARKSRNTKKMRKEWFGV